MNFYSTKGADLLAPNKPSLCFCPSCLRAGGKPRRLLALKYFAMLRRAFRRVPEAELLP